MINEDFRRIKGYENEYMISNYGRVVRLYKKVEPRQLKGHVKKNDYLRVELWKNNKGTFHYVHRLVALHFVPNSDPDNKIEVHHIDEDRRNNIWWNLLWCTRRENMKYVHRDREGECINSSLETEPVS